MPLITVDAIKSHFHFVKTVELWPIHMEKGPDLAENCPDLVDNCPGLADNCHDLPALTKAPFHTGIA